MCRGSLWRNPGSLALHQGEDQDLKVLPLVSPVGASKTPINVGFMVDISVVYEVNQPILQKTNQPINF